MLVLAKEPGEQGSGTSPTLPLTCSATLPKPFALSSPPVKEDGRQGLPGSKPNDSGQYQVLTSKPSCFQHTPTLQSSLSWFSQFPVPLF